MSPRIIFLALVAASLVLFILSLNTTVTIYNDTFDYLRTLPYYYWIGLALLLLGVTLYIKYNLSHYYGILLIALFAIYAHNRVVIINELPISHQDTFLHSAETFPILYTGLISVSNEYSSNYPLAFISMAMFMLINNTEPFLFFIMWELFIAFITPLFIYLISKTLIARPFSIIPPLVFTSLVYTNIEHFSPQSLAIGFYVLIIFFIIKFILTKKGIFFALSILLIAGIAFSNPTNSFFLLILFIFIGMMFIIKDRININNAGGTKIQVYARTTLLLALTLSLILLSKDADSMFIVSKVLLKAEELIDVSTSFDLAEDIKITPNPAPSYVYHVMLKTIFSIIIIGTGLIVVGYSVFRSREHAILFLTILVGILLFAMAITAVTATFLFTRNYTYALIIWSILTVYVATHLSRYQRIFTWLFVILIAASLVLLPVTKFGKLPTAYSPYSSYHALNILVNTQIDPNTGLIGINTLPFIYKYLTSVKNEQTAPVKITQLGHLINTKLSDGVSEKELYDILVDKVHTRTFIVFSTNESHILKLQYQLDDIYNDVEDFVLKKENLIINSSTSKIYMR